MNKRLKLGLWIAGTIVVLLAAFAALTWHTVTDGDAFVRASLPAMVQKWDAVTLRKNLSAEVFSDADILKIRTLSAQIGPIESCNIRRPTITKKQIGQHSYMALAYGVTGQNPKGFTDLDIWVAKINGAWKYVSFEISDPKHPGNNLFKPVPNSSFPLGSPATH